MGCCHTKISPDKNGNGNNECLVSVCRRHPPQPPSCRRAKIYRVDDFEDIDESVRNVPVDLLDGDYSQLATYLTRKATSDVARTRALFYWTAITAVDGQNEITDYPVLPETPRAGLIDIAQQIDNHAHFFARLCRSIGIACLVVSGVCKNFGNNCTEDSIKHKECASRKSSSSNNSYGISTEDRRFSDDHVINSHANEEEEENSVQCARCSSDEFQRNNGADFEENGHNNDNTNNGETCFSEKLSKKRPSYDKSAYRKDSTSKCSSENDCKSANEKNPDTGTGALNKEHTKNDVRLDRECEIDDEIEEYAHCSIISSCKEYNSGCDQNHSSDANPNTEDDETPLINHLVLQNESIGGIPQKANCKDNNHEFSTEDDSNGHRESIANSDKSNDIDIVGEMNEKFVSPAQWNAVLLDGEWRLLDVQWATCSIVGYYEAEWTLMDIDGQRMETTPEMTSLGQYKQRSNDFYFLTDPDRFICTHFPDDSKWQLLPKAIDKAHFCRSVYIRERFFQMRMSMLPESHRWAMVYVTDGETNITFGLSAKTGAQAQFRYSMSKLRDDTDELIRPIKGFVIYRKTDDRVAYTCRFPEAGTYRFNLYARRMDRDDDIDLICSYTMCCFNVPEGVGLLPDNPDIGWGPGYELEAAGLRAVSHMDAIIEIHENSVLIEFEQCTHRSLNISHCVKHNFLPVPLLNQSATLRQSGSVITVLIRLPEAGEYAYKLYAAERGTDQNDIPNVCNYLIKCYNPYADPPPFPRLHGGILRPSDSMVTHGVQLLSPNCGLIKTHSEYVTIRFSRKSDIELLCELNHVYADHDCLNEIVERVVSLTEVAFNISLRTFGEYGVNIFARRKNAQQIYHFHAFLLNAVRTETATKSDTVNSFNTETIGHESDHIVNMDSALAPDITGASKLMQSDTPSCGADIKSIVSTTTTPSIIDLTHIMNEQNNANDHEPKVGNPLNTQTDDVPNSSTETVLENLTNTVQSDTSVDLQSALFDNVNALPSNTQVNPIPQTGKRSITQIPPVQIIFSANSKMTIQAPSHTDPLMAVISGTDTPIGFNDESLTLVLNKFGDFRIEFYEQPTNFRVVFITAHLIKRSSSAARHEKMLKEQERKMTLSRRLLAAMERGNIETLQRILADFDREPNPTGEDMLLSAKARKRIVHLSIQKDLTDAMVNRNRKQLSEVIRQIEKLQLEDEFAEQLTKARLILKQLQYISKIKHDIMQLNQLSIAEIKSYNNPPLAIHKVLTAVLLILGESDENLQTWQQVVVFAGKMGQDSLQRRIANFDIDDLQMDIALFAKDLLDEFNNDDIRSISACAAVFHTWGRGIVEEAVARYLLTDGDISEIKRRKMSFIFATSE